MKEKLQLKIIIIAALLMPQIALRAQNTSDTITSQYPNATALSVLPGYYGYHISACLYSANEINHEAGNMTSLSYNIAPSNGYYYDHSSAKIWILETSDEALDLDQTWFDFTNSATLVFDGSLSDIEPFEIYWKEFAFTQPFAYNGGNLIILVEGVMADDYIGGTDYEIGLYTNEGNQENCWILLQDEEMIDIHTDLSQLTGAFHSNTDERPDIFFTFQSNNNHDCKLTIPYTEDFENESYEVYSDMPTCWTRISSEYLATADYYSPCMSPAAGDNSQNLFFMLMSTNSEVAVLPELDENYNIQDLTMTFQFKSAQQNTTVMAIGVMTDPADESTFTLVGTVAREGTAFAFENKEINFSTYEGTGRYIAFLFSRDYSSSIYPSCFVDNVNITSSAFCTKPVNVTSTVDGGDVTISWDYTNNAQGVRIYYKTLDDEDFEDVEVYDDNFNTFLNLPAQTTYQYYLVSLCGDDEESSATDIFTFSTECNVVNEFPWTEGFENGIACWTLNSSATGMNWALVSTGSYPDMYNTPYYPYAGNYMMEFDAFHFNEGNWGTLISPKIDFSEDRTLSFKYHTFGQQQTFDMDMFNEYPDNEDMWWVNSKEKIEVYINTELSLENATLLTTVNGYSDVAGWETATITIPAQDEESYIIFKAYYEYGYNMAIDNVTISESDNEYEPVYVTIDTAICEGNSIVLNQESYTIAGTYQITISNEDESDTIITLNLSVNPTYSITYNATINQGESYTEYGFNENATGSYYQNLETVSGCDSILILNLTVIGNENPDPVLVTIDASICEGNSYEFNGNNYSAAGTHTIISGDTTYTLNLTVNPTYNITINDSIVAGETYTNYGFNVNSAGTYYQNLETVNGCDSTITLVLTEVVGVHNYDKNNINVYPNPASDYFTISISNNDSRIYVELLDMSGRIVRNAEFESGATTLRVERGELPNGIYMLRLTSGNQRQTRKVILK